MRQLMKRLARSLGYDLTRAKPDLFDFLRSRQVEVVLDVGANTGQFGNYLRRWGYSGEIVSFEPSAPDYAVLAAAAERDGRWRAHNFALGAEAGPMTLNISEYTVFNSFLDMSEAALDFDHRAATARREEVEVKRLDTISEPYRGSSVLLKIDTQGFEHHVLDGAVNTLSFVQGVLLELPIIHLYHGALSFSQAVEYMTAAGFTIAQLHPVNFDRSDLASLIEVDCLFRRSHPAARFA